MYESDQSAGAVHFLGSFVHQVRFVDGKFILLFVGAEVYLKAERIEIEIPGLRFAGIRLHCVKPFFYAVPVVLVIVVHCVQIGGYGVVSVILLQGGFFAQQTREGDTPGSQLLYLCQSLEHFQTSRVMRK